MIVPAVDVVVIVVNYKSTRHLRRLLASVPGASGSLRVVVVVVDNDSRDDVAEVVEETDGVRLVRSGTNLGYAGGINLGMRAAPASRGTCVVNADVVLGPNSLVQLLGAAERYGAAVPRLVDHAGRTQPSLRREPTVLGAWGEALLGDRVASRPQWLSEILRESSAYGQMRWVDWATGAVLMTSRAAAARVGDWDDSFFLYSEETDYCHRLRSQGFRICYHPDALAKHHEGGSGRSSELTALLAVNRVRYFRRINGPVRSVLFNAAVATQHAIRAADRSERSALFALVSQRHRQRLPGVRGAHLVAGSVVMPSANEGTIAGCSDEFETVVTKPEPRLR